MTPLGTKLIRTLPFMQKVLVPSVITKTTLTTFLHLVFYLTWAILVARSIGIDIPLISLSAIFMIAGTIAVLPVAPSGLGTRDAALVTMLASYGISTEQAVALAFLMFISIILSGSLGAWYWTRGLELSPLSAEEHET